MPADVHSKAFKRRLHRTPEIKALKKDRFWREFEMFVMFQDHIEQDYVDFQFRPLNKYAKHFLSIVTFFYILTVCINAYLDVLPWKAVAFYFVIMAVVLIGNYNFLLRLIPKDDAWQMWGDRVFGGLGTLWLWNIGVSYHSMGIMLDDDNLKRKPLR